MISFLGPPSDPYRKPWLASLEGSELASPSPLEGVFTEGMVPEVS
jgi:hypothetical protein